MATKAISSIQGTQIADNGSATDKINLTIQYGKVLGILEASSFNAMLATIDNKAQLQAGTVVYTIAQRGRTQNYTATAEKNAPSGQTIQVDLDLEKWYNYYLETMDLARLGAWTQVDGVEISAALRGEWSKAMALGVQAYLTCKATAQALTAASTNGNTITTLTLGTPAGGGGTPAAIPATLENYRMQLWRPIALQKAAFKKIVKRSYIGTNPEDYSLIVTPDAYAELLLTTTTAGSDKSYETLITGRITEIVGFKMVENIFLGETFDTSEDGIDFDETFDLSAADIILMHKEVLAFPYLIVSAGSYTDPALANVYNLTKFIISSKGAILRPDLIKAWKLNVITG